MPESLCRGSLAVCHTSNSQASLLLDAQNFVYVQLISRYARGLTREARGPVRLQCFSKALSREALDPN